MDLANNITALYSTIQLQRLHVVLHSYTKKLRLYFIAHMSKIASENRAHNKEACLHIHCAVMNCVIAPLPYVLCEIYTCYSVDRNSQPLPLAGL